MCATFVRFMRSDSNIQSDSGGFYQQFSLFVIKLKNITKLVLGLVF